MKIMVVLHGGRKRIGLLEIPVLRVGKASNVRTIASLR
jgi:hypothetical protein